MNKLLILLLFLLPTISFSQKEAAIWYFGQYAGLDFNSGSPVVLTNGQLNTFEGCATISDGTGALLFYTDGVTVWDRSHTIMPNGRRLLGDTSSTQSAIIIPRPNNTEQYYIFTVDDNPTGFSSNGIKPANEASRNCHFVVIGVRQGCQARSISDRSCASPG